jgi:hypothetical protein
MPWILIFLIAALVCFGIPAVRAMLNRSFDYTNTGLALLTLIAIFGETTI